MINDSSSSVSKRQTNPTTLFLLVLPLIILGGLVVFFLRTGGGLNLSSPVPVETLSVERTVLKPGIIEITIRNTSLTDITIAQVIVNDAFWTFQVSPSHTIPRLGKALIRIDYPWSYSEAYAVRLFSANAIPFDIEIPVAFNTPHPNAQTFLAFGLIGLYVGVIPVYLGLLWYPALRNLSRRWMVFILAVTTGLLVFLGLDTLVEAIEQAASVPGPFQGIGLIGIGVVGTFLLLEAISQYEKRSGRSEASQRMSVAFLIAVGIGLHNLGEGLAIGASYNVGEIALGAFLVVGFIIQNITEGVAIIAPVLRDHPRLQQLIVLGLIGGAPAILGVWIGGMSPSPTLAVLFLAIGTGAVFAVVLEISRLIVRDTAREPMPAVVFSGVLAGMLVLWVTGLMIK